MSVAAPQAPVVGSWGPQRPQKFGHLSKFTVKQVSHINQAEQVI